MPWSWASSHSLGRGVGFDVSLGASVSPVLHASPDDPPTLLVHGDADTLVEINNSRLMHATLKDKGVTTDFVTIPGAGHGFRTPEHAKPATEALVNWFERHLAVH